MLNIVFYSIPKRYLIYVVLPPTFSHHLLRTNEWQIPQKCTIWICPSELRSDSYLYDYIHSSSILRHKFQYVKEYWDRLTKFHTTIFIFYCSVVRNEELKSLCLSLHRCCSVISKQIALCIIVAQVRCTLSHAVRIFHFSLPDFHQNVINLKFSISQ